MQHHVIEKTHQSKTNNVQIRQTELTNESGLSGSKHSDRTVFIIVSVPSSSSGQVGWHVEVGANVSAYATIEDRQSHRKMAPWKRSNYKDIIGICC